MVGVAGEGGCWGHRPTSLSQPLRSSTGGTNTGPPCLNTDSAASPLPEVMQEMAAFFAVLPSAKGCCKHER